MIGGEVMNLIKSIKIENVNAFNKEVEFNFSADMRTTRFKSNVLSVNNENIVKSSVIYGANNTGKSNFINTLKLVKNIFSGQDSGFLPYLFGNKRKEHSKIEIEFLLDDELYLYVWKYSNLKNSITYEKLENLTRNVCCYKVDVDNKDYQTELIEKEKIKLNIQSAMRFSAKNKMLLYSINVDEFPEFYDLQKKIENFSNDMIIINTSELDIKNSIEMLKTGNGKKLNDLVKSSDLFIDEIKYDEKFSNLNKMPESENENFSEYMKLVTTYKGFEVPSILFDSQGTKQVTILGYYIIEALENNKMLIVDELETSLHFVLTRAIVSMFNNQLNKKAQLIFTTHDVTLLDIDKLFRKEQITFIDKDDDGVSTYRLSIFTDKDGVRANSDLIKKYKRGEFKAIPNPSFFDVLEKIFISDNDGYE